MKTIRSRMILIIVISLMVVFLSSVITANLCIEIMRENSENSFENLLHGKCEMMDIYLSGIESNAKTIAYNKAIQQYLALSTWKRMQSSELRDLAVSTMTNSMIANKSILQISLIDQDSKNVITTHSTGNMATQDIRYSETAYFSEISVGLFNPANVATFYYYMPVYSSATNKFSKRIGTMIVLMTTFELRDILNEDDERDVFMLLTDQNTRVITSSNLSGYTIDGNVIRYAACDAVDEKLREQVFYREEQLEKAAWQICAVSDSYQIRWDMKSIIVSFTTLFFLCVCVLFTLYIVSMNSNRKRIEQLVGIIRGEKGNKHCKTNLMEFQAIEDSFNEMMEKISALEREREQQIKDKYTLQLAASRWEINALRCQLHPHFIYNTLEHLRGFAMFSGNNMLSEQIFELAQILRYMTKGGMYTTFSEELKVLSYYVDIIQARAGSRFKITVSYDQKLDSYRFPRMLLQPLIENCVQHGMKEKIRGGLVEVKVCLLNTQKIEISVRDNGKGMDAEKVRALQCAIEESEEEEGGIGLVANIKRVQLMYREKMKYHIMSTPQEGTLILLYLPAEEYEDADTDCR